jgi:hypothetical protein
MLTDIVYVVKYAKIYKLKTIKNKEGATNASG